MRSSQSSPDLRGVDPLWPGRNGFAHRGLHRAPAIVENSLTSFVAAIELGCGIECDVRLTADNKLVVFHDRDTARLTGIARSVAQSNYSELADLKVGNHPIPLLEQMLALVAGRVPILVEIKVESNQFSRIGPALLRATCYYCGPIGIMSFDPRVARWLRTNAPFLRRGLVIRDRLKPFRRWAAMLLADPDFLAVDIAALPRSWVAAARRRLPVYSWTSRTSADAAQVRRFADAAIWESDGRP